MNYTQIMWDIICAIWSAWNSWGTIGAWD